MHLANCPGRLMLASLALMTLASAAQSAPPVTFRVLSKIFDASGEQLAVNLTLFDSGVAYDVPQGDTRFVTVHDNAQQQVTLLDRATQVQSLIGQQDLIRITAQARATVIDPKDQEEVGLLATVAHHADKGQYQITYGRFDYLTTTQVAKQSPVAADYGHFVDSAARLNLVRRLGAPPFGRMALNDRLTADNHLPLELTRTIAQGNEKQVLRKTHELSESLTDDDRKQIEQIRGMMQLYRQVPLADFPER